MKKSPTSGFLIILSFIAIYLIWGSTYLVNKIALAEIPPVMLSGFRFVVASILIFVIALFKQAPLAINFRQLLSTMAVGILFIGLGNGLVIYGLQYIDSGFTALVISIEPLILLFLIRVFLKRRIPPKAIFGVLLGIIGMYVLMAQNQLMYEDQQWVGILCILLSIIAWAMGSILVVKSDLPKNFFVNTAYQMFFGGLALSIVSLIIRDDWSIFTHLSLKVSLSMIYLILFGSIAAFTAFNYLLKHVETEKVATSNYVNPVVAMFLGWLFLDEMITHQTIVAAIIMLTGVYFINSNKPSLT